MLKKKEWLQEWKKRMLAGNVFSPYFVNSRLHVAALDRKDGLTPAESANFVIELMEDSVNANKSWG